MVTVNKVMYFYVSIHYELINTKWQTTQSKIYNIAYTYQNYENVQKKPRNNSKTQCEIFYSKNQNLNVKTNDCFTFNSLKKLCNETSIEI